MNRDLLSSLLIGIFVIGTAYIFIGDVISYPQSSQSSYPDRSELLAQRWRFQEILFTYGGQDSLSTARYQKYAETQQSRYRRRRLVIKPADNVTESELITHPTYIVGTGKSNIWLNTLATQLPFSITPDGFSFNEKTYTDSSDVLMMVHPNPLLPKIPVYTILGNSDTHLLSFLESRSFSDIRGDYQIFQGGQCIVFGLFSTKGGEAWEIDSNQHRDYLVGTDVLTTEDEFTITSHQVQLSQNEKETFIKRRRDLLESIQTTMDIDLTPMEIHLYSSFEDKGLITNNTDLAHNAIFSPEYFNFMSRRRATPIPVIENDNAIHMVYREDIPGDDGQCETQFQIRHEMGKPASEILEAGLSVYFTRQWRGKGYEYWASRLYQADRELSLQDLIQPKFPEAQSHLVNTPLAGSLVAHLIETWGVEQFKQAYASWMPNPTEIEALEPGWHAYLAQLEKNYQAQIIKDRQRFPKDDSFQKGFCYSHEGYQIYNGYLSRKGDESLERMAEIGTNAVSITPFTSMRDPKVPQPLRLWHNAGGENDESVIHSTLSARSQGMRVMMKPHIWVSRSWPGEIEMESESDWAIFFNNYYQWIQHYALLSEMYDIDILCAGVEMGLTTVGHEDQWREMILKLRHIYSGPIVYAPNWGWEFEQVSFWDAFDYIGVNNYYPLSESESATDEELNQGALKIADRMEGISRKYKKPILITEMGFKSSRGTWIKPYDYKDERVLNLDHQTRAYEAIISALSDRSWLKGIYWWKWPTQLEHGGLHNDDFTPNGKPAEKVVAKWYKEGF